MSSTNSSVRLTLLSYATFNYHIPIHDHSWRQHQWKQTEMMVALASLALQSAKKLFQKGNLENKCVILTLSGADVRARSVGIDPYTFWGLYRFFSRTFPYCPQTVKLNHSVLSGSDGGSLWRLLCSLVHPKTQHLKSLFGADSVYLQQLQQVISNGGGRPQLLTQGCVYAYRAASQMGGTFSPQWREQRENLKQLILRDGL